LGKGNFQAEVYEQVYCPAIGTADWLTQQNRQLSIGTSRTEQVRSKALWVRQ